MKRISALDKTRRQEEFGDFQTPPALAAQVCDCVRRAGVQPRALIEPSCGLGSLFIAGLDAFPSLDSAFAIDVNDDYVRRARERLLEYVGSAQISLEQADFFKLDWPAAVELLPEPVLLLGNPPWVTNSALGALQSDNLPFKQNLSERHGLDALTGKSNFDISE